MPSLRQYDDIFRSQESDAGEALDRIRREQVAMRLQPDEDPELARRNIESRHAVLSPRYQALEGTLRQQGEQARIESFPQVEDVPVFKHLLSPFVDKEPAGTRKPYSPDELAARATNKQRLMESLASPTQAPDIPEDVRAQIVHSIQVGHPQVPEEYAQHVPEDLRSQVERGAIEPIEAVNPFEAPTRPLRGLAYTPLKLGAAAAGTAVGGPVVGLGAYGEAEKRLQALDPEGNKWEPVGALTRAGLGGVSGIVQGDKTLGEIIEGAKNAMTETGKQPASFEELFAEAGYDPAVGKVLSFATEMGLQAAPLHEILSRAGLQGQAERKLTAPERVRKLQATRTGEAPRPLPDEPALTPRADREKPSQRLGRGTIAETAQETLQRLSERAQNAPPGSEARLTAQEQLQQLERAKETRNPSEGFGAGTVGAAQRGAGAEGEPSGKGGGRKKMTPEDRIKKLDAQERELRADYPGGIGAMSPKERATLSRIIKERAALRAADRPAQMADTALGKAFESPEKRSEAPVPADVDMGQLEKWMREKEALRAERRSRLGPEGNFTPEEVKQFEEPTSRETAAQEDLVALREELDKAVEYRKSVEDDAARGMADPEEVADARKVEETAKQALDRIREPQVPPPAPTPQEPNLPSAEQAPQEAPLEAPGRVRVGPGREGTPADMGALAEFYDRQRREEMRQAQATPEAETQRPATAEEALNRLREGAAQEPMQPGAQEGIGLPGETTERRRLEVPPPTATPTKGRVHEDLLATARPTYRIGQGAPSQIEFIDPADKVIYTVTNRGAKSKTHDSSLAALKKAGYTDAEIAARGKEIRANLKKQYAADPGSDLRIGERPQQGTPAASEPQPMTPQEILRQFNEEEVARRAEIERQAVPPPPKRPGPVPSPQARGESPTAAPTGVSPAAPPGFGVGGKKRAKGAPPVVEPPHTVEENGRTAGENDAVKMADLEDQAAAQVPKKQASTPAAPPGSPLGPPAFNGPPVAQPGKLADVMKAPSRDFWLQKQSDLNLRNLMPDVAPELYVRTGWETERAFMQEQRLLDTAKGVVGKLSPAEKRNISVLLDSIRVKDAAELHRVVTQPVSAARTTHERILAAAGANTKAAFKVIRSIESELFDQMVKAGEIPAGVEKPAYFPHVGAEEFWRDVVKVDVDKFRSLDPGDRGAYIHKAIKRFDDLSPETKEMWLRSSNPNAPGISAAQSRASYIQDLNDRLNEVEQIKPRVDKWNTPMDEVFFRHALKRSGGSWYKLDLEPVLESYFTMATRRAIQGPTIREFYELSQTPEWQKVPNIVKYISNQLNQWVGAPAFPDTVINQMAGIRGLVTSMPIHRAATKLRGLVSAGNLWGNPLSAVKQLLDLSSFPQVVGGDLKAIARATGPASGDVMAAIWDANSPQRAEIIRNNLTNAKSITALTEDFQGKGWNATNRVMYSMIRTADTAVRVSTYFTAKRLAERIGLSPKQLRLHGTPEHWARAVANEVAGTLVRGLSPQSQHTTLGKLIWHFAYIPGKQIGRAMRAAFGKERETAGPGLLNRIRGNIGAPPLALTESAKRGALATLTAQIMTLAGLVALGYSKERATTIALGGTPASPLSMLTGSQSSTDLQPIGLSPEMQAIVNGIRYLTADTEDEREDAARDLQKTGVGFIPGGRMAQKLGDVAIDLAGEDSPIPFLRSNRKKSGVSLTETGGQVRPQTTRRSLTDIIAGRLFSRETEPEAQMRYTRDDMRAMGDEKQEVTATAHQMARTGNKRGAVKMLVDWGKSHPGADIGRDIGSLIDDLSTPQGTTFGRSAGTALPEARRAFLPGTFSNPKARRLAKAAAFVDDDTVRRILLQKAEAAERGGGR